MPYATVLSRSADHVLAALGAHFYTIELVSDLADRATDVLQDLGFDQVQTRRGDGFAGWSDAAPFESILVTACTAVVPTPLIEQLSVGGRIVTPIGSPRA